MDDWHYFFNHNLQNINTGCYRIFEPQWQAEIMDWFNSSNVINEQKEAFIQALLDFDDGCGGFYRHRAFLLAARSLAQFKDCSQASVIVDQLLKWSYAYFQQEKQDWRKYPEPLAEAARATLYITDRSLVIPQFAQLLHTTESRFVLRHAAERLGKLDPGNKSAIAALGGLIQVTQNNASLLKTARALMHIAPTHPLLLPTFIKLTQIVPEDWWILLEKAFKYDLLAINMLLEELETPKYTQHNDVNRCQLASYLLKIDPGNSTAITILVQFLKTAKNPSIRWQAADSLTNNSLYCDMAVEALLDLVEIAYTDYPPLRVVSSLKRIDPTHQLAISALIKLLQKSLTRECFEQRVDLWQVAEELGEIGAGNQLAIDALTQFITDAESQLNLGSVNLRSAAESLGRIDPGNLFAVNTLVNLIETTDDYNDRLEAVSILGRIDPGNLFAVNTLVNLIETTDDYNDRLEAVSILGRIDPGNLLAVNTLVNSIETTIVTGLRDCMSKHVINCSSYLYEDCYRLIWHCAQHMTYPNFYQAWHK